jgi:hypothetical protein
MVGIAGDFHLFIGPLRKLLSSSGQDAVLKLMKEPDAAAHNADRVSRLTSNNFNPPNVIGVSCPVLKY